MSKHTQTSAVKLYRRLLRGIVPYRSIFALSILGHLIYAVSQAGFAELMRYFIEALESKSPPVGTLEAGIVTSVIWVPILGFFVALVRGIGYFIGNFAISVVGQNVVRDLRDALFETLVHLPAAYFDKQSSGRLLSKVSYDVTMVTVAATNAITIFFREGLTVIILLSYMLYHSWKLTLIFFLIGPVLAITVSWIGKRMRRLSTGIQDAMGGITQVTSDALRAQNLVKAAGAQDYEIGRFQEVNAQNRRQQIKFELMRTLNSPVMQSMVAVGLSIVMYLVLVMREDYATSVLIAYVTAAALLPKSLRSLGDVYGQIQKGVAAAESIFELMDESRERDTGTFEPVSSGKTSGKTRGKIDINGLSFTYPGAEKAVLQDITLSIEPGETVALVGASGSGKTTLASLLTRAYDTHQGEILLDGTPVTDYALRALRRQFALVSQQVVLFDSSVADNIAYGECANATMEAVKAAATAAYADGFIHQLPQGYDTVLGEDAVTLSGGQQQRLAIARAILRDAPVLILDEATSALDNESEQYIQTAMTEVTKGRTTLIIAHRLSTIEKADRIVVMDNGRILEEGTHHRLLALGGAYARLHRRGIQSET